MLSVFFKASLTKKIIALISIFNTLLFFIFVFSKYYPTYLMYLHFVTIIILWIIVFRKLEVIKIIQAHAKEVIVICFLILLSLFVRIDRINELSPGLWGDEIAVGSYSQNLIKQNELPPFVINHPYSTPVTFAIGESLQFFGHTVIALRLPIIIIGSLTVGIFYILLRLYFPISISILGALIMTFQYTQVVLSRLAYEPIPSLFFQVLTAIFLTLYHKTKSSYYLLGIALSLVGGLYTYLNFRPFAAAVLFLTIFLIIKNNPKTYFSKIILFLGAIFIIGEALISFQLTFSQVLWSRASEISIFSQHFSQIEFIKEFWGNILRTGSFAITGDPNPGHNPAGVPPFDLITFALSFLGFIYLFFKKRGIFWVSLIFMLPPFVSDIFSIERISEFHYYGLGHPHALRISGWIFVILFVAAFGIWAIYSKAKKMYEKEIMIALWITVIIISLFNWNWYFNQLSVNPNLYYWNYTYHNAAQQELINFINKSLFKKITLSKGLWDSDVLGFQFFINPEVSVTTFDPSSSKNCITAIISSDMSAIELTPKTIPIIQELISANDTRLSGYSMQTVKDPAFNINHIIYFTKMVY